MIEWALETAMNAMTLLVNRGVTSDRLLKPNLTHSGISHTISLVNECKSINTTIELFTRHTISGCDCVKAIELTRRTAPSDGHIFSALFDDKDTDFLIKVTNQSLTRDMRLTLFYDKDYQFIFGKSSSHDLDVLEDNGNRLHFWSPNQSMGQKMVQMVAKEGDPSDGDNAVAICSQIKFTFEAQDTSIKVNVKQLSTPNGQTFELSVGCNDKITKLKDQIHDITSLPTDRQRIVFNGQQLIDTKTIDEYYNEGIHNDSILNLYSCESNEMPLFVRTLDSEPQLVIIKTNHTVDELKRQLEPLLDIPMDRQRIVFNKHRLMDDKTVDEYKDLGISDEKQLLVFTCQPNEIPVFVRSMVGHNQTNLININAVKVIQLKRQLVSITGISADQQVIVYHGRPLADNETVDECHISDGSKLFVYSSQTDDMITIFVKIMKQTVISLQTKKQASVELIRELIEDKEDIPQSEQRLIYNGKILEDGNHIEDYNISNGSTLNLLYIMRGGAQLLFGGTQSQPLDPRIGQRGVKGFGAPTNSLIPEWQPFTADTTYEFEPFCIELCLRNQLTANS